MNEKPARRRKPAPSLYNRETKGLEEELVYQKWFMDLFYRTAPGRAFTSILLNKRCVSRLYGALARRRKSRMKIRPFVSKYRIDTGEIDGELSDFHSFNDFFIRKLKASARPIEEDPDVLISPADSRLIVIDVKDETVIPIKNDEFTLQELLGNPETARPFYGGLCLKFRLAPVDYHRFCYFDEGRHGPIVSVGGVLHSIHPIALERNHRIMRKNYREYCVLHTKHFGPAIHIDVGSFLVGSIRQNLRGGGAFSRGQEKGFFELGGSTIIVLLKPDVVAMDEDIVEYSRRGIETMVKYGSRIGRNISSTR